MKLNNKKTGIACMIGVAVLASSCSDWLDPKPLSFYTPEISFADYNGHLDHIYGLLYSLIFEEGA